MRDFGDELIKIFQYVNEDIEEGDTDQKSDESEDMLRDEKYQKCKEYRELHIRGNYFWIEVICFHCMYENCHTDDSHNDACPTIIVSDDKNRNSGKKGSENRDESEDENDNPKSDDVRKSSSFMEKTDNQKSENSEYRIHECNNCLRFKDKTESFGDFSEDDTIFFIKKWEIPSFHRLKIIAYLPSIYEKHVTQNKGDKEFRKENSDIFDIFKCSLYDFLNRYRIENTAQRLIDTEIHIYAIFQAGNSALKLIRNDRSILDESFSFLQ